MVKAPTAFSFDLSFGQCYGIAKNREKSRRWNFLTQHLNPERQCNIKHTIMKKLIVIFLLNMSLNCFAQKDNFIPVPSSVSVLGPDYEVLFREQAGILSQMEKELSQKKGAFTSVNSLVAYSCSRWSQLSGQVCDVDINELSNSLSATGPTGSNFQSYINGLKLSDELKRNLLDINTSIRLVETVDDLNSILYNYSTGLAQSNLSPKEKESLRMYIVGMNYGYYVLMNCAAMKQILFPEGDGHEINRSIWGIIKAAIRCGLGTIGGALLGSLGGAAAGTFTVPVIGTASGAAVGFWGGAMAGASQSCFE
jgi:hypothetical protein